MEFLFFLGKFLLFTLLSELFRPKLSQSSASASLSDVNFPTVDPTRPIPWLIGRRMIANANLFATFDFLANERHKTVRGDFLGLTSQNIPLPTEYYIGAAMTLCGGSGVKLKEIWIEDVRVWAGNAADGDVIYIDYSTPDGGSEDNPVGFRGYVEFHSGSATPSAYLESKQGVGNVPAWSHLTYVVLRGPLTSAHLLGMPVEPAGAWVGTNPTVKLMKFCCERMPTAVTTGLGAHPDGGNYWSIGNDANPAYASAELLVDPHYAAGMSISQFDAAKIHDAAKKLYLEGNGISLLWDSQRASGEVVIEICKQMGGILQPDRLTGLQTLRLLRAEDTPVFIIDDSNIKQLTSFSRAAADEASNSITCSYTDTADKWLSKPVEVQDLAAIELAGQVITGTASYAGIMTAANAQAIGSRDLRALSSPLAGITVSAIVPQRQKFMPGDTVGFSSVKNGIGYLRARVSSARYSTPGEAVCDLELIEDVFLAGTALYTTPAPVASTTALLPSGSAGLQYYSMAPRAMSGEAADHAMWAMSGGDASQTTLTVGWNSVNSSTPASMSYAQTGSTFALSVDAALASALAWSATGAVNVVMSAVNCSNLLNAISRFGSSTGVPAVFTDDSEYVVITGVTITSDTSATLTINKRGMYDTVPVAHSAGSRLMILLGPVVDPLSLSTLVPSTGTFARSYSGVAFSRFIAHYKNGAGTGTATYSIGIPANTVSRSYIARGARPVMPGNVTLDGKTGAKYSETLPVVSLGGRSSVRLAWVNRGYGEDTTADWFTAVDSGNNSLYIVYSVWTAANEAAAASGSWTQIKNGRQLASIPYIDLANTYFTTAGKVVKVVVIAVEQIDATQDIVPWNVNYGNEFTASSTDNVVGQLMWKMAS